MDPLPVDSGPTQTASAPGNSFGSVATDLLAMQQRSGEMAERIAAYDWSLTPLGPMDEWPQTLKAAVRIILGSRYPMFIWWGRDRINLYKDGYLPMLGKRHPDALGQPASAVWSEIWDIVGPQSDAVLQEGRATWNERRLLILERNGYPEETYFTFSYSPLTDEDGQIRGVFCALSEDTQRVLAQRRLQLLRDLSAQTTAARTVEQACKAAAATLAQHPHDLPFALIYLVDEEAGVARLTATTGLTEGSAASPPLVDLTCSPPARWPFSEVANTRRPQVVENLSSVLSGFRCGIWPESPQVAVVLPLMQPIEDRLAGFVVAGVSPRRALDDDYRGFMEIMAGQISTAIVNARAYEAERRRAEALAELDRAKTTFFSNISHEFRTPLTLMLGPVADALADVQSPLPATHRERFELVHRNGMRLLKLVNTLLDFSRIEAGRINASYEAIDLAAFTADLASNFRSACERAGLDLIIDCPPISEAIFVDRQMWEKIVFNLLSNAFKFTFHGEIRVSLRRVDGFAQLVVKDTGTGIAAHHIPRLFERFHRIENAQARTHEGSGIGLAMVQELVRLHGGSVVVESAVGRGTSFTVSIPFGTEHLPTEQIKTSRSYRGTVSEGASAFVEEALRWLPQSDSPPVQDEPMADRDEAPAQSAALGIAGIERPRVLVVDDNADMRHYLVRLLRERYLVEAVPDGAAALAAVRSHRPDLILSDVMMPNLDGFALVRELRSDPMTASLPIILISARAGEEDNVAGIETGADDYLVKPFSANELLARVSGHLQMARLRAAAEAALRDADRRKDEFLATLAHELRNPLAPLRNGLQILRLSQGDPTTVEEARAMMERQLGQMVHLVDDLLDLSRIGRGKLELRKERVELRRAIEQAIEASRPAIEQLGHRFTVEMPSEPIYVDGDVARLAQVFSNLLNNAAKYTERGGRIELIVRRLGAEVLVSVKDNGIGIPAPMLSRIFDIFAQVDQASDRTQGGLGIGLAIVKKLVEMHRGTVEVKSEGSNKGSEFVVRLPAVTAAQPVPAAAQPSRPVACHRVLVVDDNQDAARSLATMLKFIGNEVATAHDGLEALEIVPDFAPDLILLDIEMPRLNGYETAKRLREQPWGQRVTLVALTGWTQDEDRRQSRDAGFDFHLVKPIELAALEKLLAELPHIAMCRA